MRRGEPKGCGCQTGTVTVSVEESLTGCKVKRSKLLLLTQLLLTFAGRPVFSPHAPKGEAGKYYTQQRLENGQKADWHMLGALAVGLRRWLWDPSLQASHRLMAFIASTRDFNPKNMLFESGK